jgi:hypothetical protein
VVNLPDEDVPNPDAVRSFFFTASDGGTKDALLFTATPSLGGVQSFAIYFFV